MVRIIVLALLLSACASNSDKPKFGKEVQPPYGWQQWCIDNPTDKDCHLN